MQIQELKNGSNYAVDKDPLENGQSVHNSNAELLENATEPATMVENDGEHAESALDQTEPLEIAMAQREAENDIQTQTGVEPHLDSKKQSVIMVPDDVVIAGGDMAAAVNQPLETKSDDDRFSRGDSKSSVQDSRTDLLESATEPATMVENDGREAVARESTLSSELKGIINNLAALGIFSDSDIIANYDRADLFEQASRFVDS
jgi:hypothetical protein